MLSTRMALLRLVFPDVESKEPAFREEVNRLSVQGMRVIAAVGLLANLMSYGLWLLWMPSVPSWMLTADAVGIGLAALGLGLTAWRPLRLHARWMSLLLLFAGFTDQILTTTGRSDLPVAIQAFVPILVATALLLAVTALPVKPLQTLAFGGSLTAVFFFASYGPRRYLTLSFAEAFPVSVLAIVIVMATVLTVAVYQQRVSAFLAWRAAAEALEALKVAQGRLMVSENAASQNRFAAAMCHELNTPLGALSSAFSTLIAAHGKTETTDSRVAEVVADAAQAGRQSIERLDETVGRMKRLTNLDRAEVQVVDLNELWRDTVHFMDESLAPRVRFELELSPLPAISCQPEKLAAVFGNLVRNAAGAIPTNGTIRIRTGTTDSDIVMEVEDDGKGIPEARLANIFEPAFRRDHGRVDTGNWGLFVARGIVVDHGGEIGIQSVEGKGTIARIRLPTSSTKLE